MTAGILLCAGASRRFLSETPKMLASFRGRPLVTWAIDHVMDARFDETMVVTGSVDLSGLVPPDALVVENLEWDSGQASSLLAGIAKAQERGHEVVVVGLGDQPLVPPEAWLAVAASKSEIAVASFEGRCTPPTRLTRATWSLLPQHGDVGARTLMQSRPDLVEIVPCPGEALDIDTVEDLALWG